MKVGYQASVCFILTVMAVTVAGAQTFRGTVLDDSTKRPLEAATLALVDANGKDLGRPAVRSDSLGRFALHAGAAGRYAVRVSRIGYAPLTSTTIELVGGGVAQLNLAMSAVQQKLGTIVVTEQRRLNRFELYSELGFDLRRAKGNGKFLDTLDLAEYKNHPAASVLVDHGLGVYYAVPPGGSILSSERLVMYNGLNSNGRFRECFPGIWIDGFTIVNEKSRLETLGADEIFAVEVYSHLQLPPASIGADLGAGQSSIPRATRCGVIAVWTKGYIKEMKAKEAKKVPSPQRSPDL